MDIWIIGSSLFMWGNSILSRMKRNIVVMRDYIRYYLFFRFRGEVDMIIILLMSNRF